MRIEAKIEQEACDLVLNRLGIESSKLSTPGDTGIMDRIFWMPGGRPFLIEFKDPEGVWSPKQKYHYHRLIKLGYDVEVHDSSVRAFAAVCRAVDPAHLSKEGRAVLAEARVRWSVPAPWAGQDDYRLESPDATLQGKGHIKSIGSGALARLLQHVAGGDPEVGRLQRPPLRRAPRRRAKGK